MSVNALIKESSPYLLQHAHNPVNWQAWNEASWEQARSENKPVLISIGYSACHWCHVMERESFEDKTVAEIMNEHFICIKVDREERPDVDQIYMSAVQLMTGHGGWPLNCFATPDGRPVYGGTYFPKEKWMNVLFNLADLWKNETNKVYEYAAQLTEGVKQSELITIKKEKAEILTETLLNSWQLWSARTDKAEGGPNKAPKFPLPNNYLFLLHLSQSELIPQKTREDIHAHVSLTLRKMAFGGIYDHLGGGFARYSTDTLWKVPHFEKMLYDNAQLVCLYSEAWLKKPDLLYKQVVFETLGFIQRELTSPEGIAYSALDADSEGVEGRYYVWTEEELRRICGDDFPLWSAYYSVNEEGLWEHSEYILLRREEEDELSKQFGITPDVLRTKINTLKTLLLEEREKRVRPGLDDKSLASWNGLLLQAYTQAYRSFREPRFLQAAKKTASFLLKSFSKPDSGLYHTYKHGKASINGFLEDYCFLMEGLFALYEITFEEEWLKNGADLCTYVINHFYDPESGFFFFTSSQDKPLIARKFELSDNVIPASNSSMAKCLFLYGHFLDRTDYIAMARRMLVQLQEEIAQYGAGYSNWGLLQLRMLEPLFEVAIVGKDVEEKRSRLQEHSISNVIFAGSSFPSSLPLLRDRHREGQTLVYVCREKSCFAPVSKVEDALKLLNTTYEA
jgi:uncharacterized protein YyaL (SSP411 family)